MNPALLDANPSFNVLIAYEDFETGKHAKRTYDFLVENIGGDWNFSNQMWKFDVLLLPKLREIALDDAARADIIIISYRSSDLPDHIKAWVESWLTTGTNPLALVALFDPSCEPGCPGSAARDYLADVARRGNMEFFAQPDISPGSKSVQSTRGGAENPRSANRALSTLAGAVQGEANLPRWTCNE